MSGAAGRGEGRGAYIRVVLYRGERGTCTIQMCLPPPPPPPHLQVYGKLGGRHELRPQLLKLSQALHKEEGRVCKGAGLVRLLQLQLRGLWLQVVQLVPVRVGVPGGSARV